MSLFSSSNPDSSPSSHKNEHPSFSEAVLDSSSRTRDSIPEQYRETFNELRDGILVFCKEFQIPVESLSNTETFEAALRSKKIPPKRMAEAVLLFQRLEYLIANKEPLKEDHTEALEYADRLFHLTEQYTAQVSLLERAGILKDGGITGIDGNNYPIPSLEEIAERLYSPERRELFEIKQDQKFIKLLLVPFGMSLDELIEIFKQFLKIYKNTHSDFDLVVDTPFFILPVNQEYFQEADIGNSPKLLYNPQPCKNWKHPGKTKLQIIEDQSVGHDFAPGWKVLFLQASHQSTRGFRSIPRQGKGRREGGEISRPDVEADKNPEEYLSLFLEAQRDPRSPYHGESGMTPEDWILAFMTHLEETGKPLDSGISYLGDYTFLIGSFFESSGDYFSAYWDQDKKQARLDKSSYTFRRGGIGVRSSVIV